MTPQLPLHSYQITPYCQPRSSGHRRSLWGRGGGELEFLGSGLCSSQSCFFISKRVYVELALSSAVLGQSPHTVLCPARLAHPRHRAGRTKEGACRGERLEWQDGGAWGFWGFQPQGTVFPFKANAGHLTRLEAAGHRGTKTCHWCCPFSHSPGNERAPSSLPSKAAGLRPISGAVDVRQLS